VRDELLGLKPTDYDIATNATPGHVRKLFPVVHEVGIAFGVMLVVIDRTPVEVATFRTDGQYTDGRRPNEVTFADERADALRRDFTINALFLDPLENPDPNAPSSPLGGAVIDYVGGLADLKAKTIRAVGIADDRLNEDHLRALRAVRFAARLGMTIEPQTARAIANQAGNLSGISKERIGEEIRRMLTHPARGKAIDLLQTLGLDGPTLREESLGAKLVVLTRLPHKVLPLATVLCAWLLDRHGGTIDQEQAKIAIGRWRTSLCLTNEERDGMLGTFQTLSESGAWSGMSVASRKRIASKAWFAGAIDLVRAQLDRESIAEAIEQDVRQLSDDGIGLSPTPLVSGDDLVANGSKPSPRFKHVLSVVYDAQLEGRVRSKVEGLELARELGV
jgi:poly(A) polymerase